MRVKNNFVSCVVIGSFNPSILTSDFIIQECGLEFEGKAIREDRTPVVSRVEYPGFMFLADLDRLQIRETEIDDPGKSKVVDFLRIYLEKLPYTPLSKCGVNINVSISGTNEKDLIALLTERKRELFKILETRDFTIEATSQHQSKGDKFLKWNIVYVIQKEHVLGRLAITIKGESVYEVNHNYEVGRLEKNHSRLQIVTQDYPKVVKRYEQIIRAIFEEA